MQAFIIETSSSKTINTTSTSFPQVLPTPQTPTTSALPVQTFETSTQHYFLTKLLRPSSPVLFVGPAGCGKSTAVSNYLLRSVPDKTTFNLINFSAHTRISRAQEIMLKRLDRRRKGVYGPSMGKCHVLFVDDLNAPRSRAPLELLRQWIEHGHLFDPQSAVTLNVVDASLIGAMLPVSSPVSPRLTRHAYVMAVDMCEYATLLRIYTIIVNRHFEKDFAADKSNFNKSIAKSTIDLYFKVMIES